MEMRQLQMFVAVSEELSFTRAAERVHTVQSNVTSQIKNLEEDLGARLFDRFPRRLALTDAGARFLPYAQRVLATLDEGERAVKFGNVPCGPLRIGAPESIVTYRLPPALRVFRQRCPNVELVIRPSIEWPLTELLQSGECDLAIRLVDTIGKKEKALRWRPLGTEHIVLVTAPCHPLAARKPVRLIDLQGHVLLLTETACPYRRKLERILSANAVKPQTMLEFTSVEAIKQCVLLGMGIALLPEMAVAKELEKHTLQALSWRGPDLDMPTHVFWHKDKWLSPAVKEFLGTLGEMRNSNGGYLYQR